MNLIRVLEDHPIILASSSPRRAALLRQIGVSFTQIAPDIREPDPNLAETSPEEISQQLAQLKTAHVADRYDDSLVVGADTLVVHEDRVLGKPHDAGHARVILTRLSGQRHSVTTGVALIMRSVDLVHTFAVTTEVKFRELSVEEIDTYINTGEPMDKAGAYGIQGQGALLIEEIRGDYNNVVGFPLTRFHHELRRVFADIHHGK